MLTFYELGSKIKTEDGAGRWLFRHMGASLLPGACLVLRGANGTGKTTLLRLLSGLDIPTEGAISWHGEPIRNNSEFINHCQPIWHKNALKPSLTVEENLLFWARLNDSEMLMPAATHIWSLENVLDQRLSKLSQGWQRRVALARLLVSPGELWLMDEPMANLDKEGIDILERLIQSRCSQGGIVILSSHIEIDLPFADQLFIQDYNEHSNA